MDTMPLFYTEEEKALLKGSPALRTLNKRLREMDHDYNLLKEKLEEFENISYEEFAYHRCLASSRVFGFIINGMKTGGMVPFIDMINHKRPKQSLWSYDNKMNSFKIEAFGDCKQGVELFDSYGKKCNSRFLLNYGFIEEDNDANEYELIIEFDETFPFFKEKVHIIPKINNFKMSMKISRDFERQTFFEFMSFLRYTMIDNMKELQLVARYLKNHPSQSEGVFQLGSISKHNETLTLDFLENLCLRCLEKYGTSLEEDKHFLATENLSYNQENCIRLRMGEKEVLHEVIKFCKSVKKLMNYTPQEIQMMVDHYPYKLFKKFITDYVYKIVVNNQG